MTKAGERILEGAREALAIAMGEQPAARIHINGHAYVPVAALLSERTRAREEALEEAVREVDVSADRVDFDAKGQLDEVFSSRGAHLERMSTNHWFLIFYHADGTESAFWFDSKDLKKPFWETRPPMGPAGGEDAPSI